MILDASVLIGHADADDAHHARAVDLLLDHAGEPFRVNPLTLAEFLVGPAREGRLADAELHLATLRVEAVALSADAPRHLAELRAGTGLRLPDCCVLLTAFQTGEALASFDADLRRAASGLGLVVR